MYKIIINLWISYLLGKKLIKLKNLFLFALSSAVKADFILTGDKRLWALKKYKRTEIISYSDFISRLEFAK